MKRKKWGKAATKAARLAWVRGQGRYSGPPRKLRADWEAIPDRVMIALAALVPESHECEGHEERVAAHAARVALAPPDYDTRREIQCDACGLIAPRLGNQPVGKTALRKPASREKSRATTAPRWKCRRVPKDNDNVMYCPECFARWGWQLEPGALARAVTCSDERGR